MADEAHTIETTNDAIKRKSGRKKIGSRNKKRPKMMGGGGNKIRVDRKMKKLFRKRAREYNSDDDDDNDNEEPGVSVIGDDNAVSVRGYEEVRDEALVGEEEEEEEEEGKVMNAGSDSDADADAEGLGGDEDGVIQPGITKFTEGCRAFRAAFRSILKKSVSDESLGPILSANTKLVAEKLAEEEAERKVKGEAKKEKNLVGEKGHVKPATYLDSHEKFLIGVATKGAVKLFNAVNKAQHAQKGLDPSRSRDAKAIKKRRKEAFFSELGKPTLSSSNTHESAADAEGPAWAPLRDNYMLTNSKLKDWDKMPESTVAEDSGRMPEDSSDED